MDPQITKILLLIVPVLFSISVHEVCHGYVAYLFGDPTAKLAGRLTLNPIKHIDIIGLLVLFITQMIGWAKPVPVDPRYFKNPRKDMMWVALAGPASNMIIAIISAFILKAFGGILGGSYLYPIVYMLNIMVMINVGLAIFNLIPIPPLDGGRIIVGLLPQDLAYTWSRIEPYGFIILLVLIFTRVINVVLFPAIIGIINVLLSI
ncbi:MAG: site-2 protease family protein [Thermodesulfobacteriota bacterium]|nr:site-2 protease family protein [Thermodesulfobacteriota bacterium]